MCKVLSEMLNGMQGHEGVWDGGSMQLRSYQSIFLHLQQRDNTLFSYLIHIAYGLSGNYLISLLPFHAHNKEES